MTTTTTETTLSTTTSTSTSSSSADFCTGWSDSYTRALPDGTSVDYQYYYSDTKKSYIQASVSCHMMTTIDSYSNLVQIFDEPENKFVANLAPDPYHDERWIGGKRLRTPGPVTGPSEFVFFYVPNPKSFHGHVRLFDFELAMGVFDEKFYRKIPGNLWWPKNGTDPEPNDAGGKEDCISMGSPGDKSKLGYWSDVDCGSKLNWVCKRETPAVCKPGATANIDASTAAASTVTKPSPTPDVATTGAARATPCTGNEFTETAGKGPKNRGQGGKIGKTFVAQNVAQCKAFCVEPDSRDAIIEASTGKAPATRYAATECRSMLYLVAVAGDQQGKCIIYDEVPSAGDLLEDPLMDLYTRVAC